MNLFSPPPRATGLKRVDGVFSAEAHFGAYGRSLAASVPAAAALALMVFGPAFVNLLAAAALLVAVLHLIVRRAPALRMKYFTDGEGFTIDTDGQRFVTPRGSIGFAEVERVDLLKRGQTFTAMARGGRALCLLKDAHIEFLGPISMAIASASPEGIRVEEREAGRFDRATRVAFGAAVVVLAAYAYAHLSLTSDLRAFRLYTLDPTVDAEYLPGPDWVRYGLGPLLFSLPPEFSIPEERVGEIVFYDTDWTRRVVVQRSSLPTAGPVSATALALASGVSTEYAFVRMGIMARFGLTELLLKRALVRALDDSRAYTYASGSVRAVILAGTSPEEPHLPMLAIYLLPRAPDDPGHLIALRGAGVDATNFLTALLASVSYE
jgi:hypothetical protein